MNIAAESLSQSVTGLLVKWRHGTVFEVDHPATQAVKREVFARLGIPANVQFVATEFERDDFVVKLCAARFVSERRSLVVWLGVKPLKALTLRPHKFPSVQ